MNPATNLLVIILNGLNCNILGICVFNRQHHVHRDRFGSLKRIYYQLFQFLADGNSHH